MTDAPGCGSPRPLLAFVLIASGTVLGIAGTDLVLPAVPSLPEVLGGSPAQAQLVLATFVAGTALGLLLFGELGARYDQRWLLAGSLAAYGLLSAAASLAPSLGALVWLRLVQGAAGSAAAVFAPGMIRLLFGGNRAVRALGLLGSIESLVPALAPIVGVWLLARFGWRASFDVVPCWWRQCVIACQVPDRRLGTAAMRRCCATGLSCATC
jgi:DHA1 family bicyclomycin/chloramphenicol resistance-like MFS transporter